MNTISVPCRYTCVMGDIHGNLEAVVRKVKEHSLRDMAIIHLGDFGAGFELPKKEKARADYLNRFLAGRNIHLYILRGNHDNPAWFRGSGYDCSNITFMPDYTLLRIGDKQVLCVGGAVSVDRVDRKKSREKPSTTWWPDEVFVLHPDKLKGVTPDVVCTHTAPHFCPPSGKGDIVDDYVSRDPLLPDDLRKERFLLTSMLDLLEKSRLTEWYYGHFHQYNCLVADGITFTGLAIDQLLPVQALSSCSGT